MRTHVKCQCWYGFEWWEEKGWGKMSWEEGIKGDANEAVGGKEEEA